jgi:hypothetical protein
MGDGRFTVPIVADDGRVLYWGRGDCEVPYASYHMRMGTQLRYLRVVDGAVVEISQEAKDAIAAADALAEQKRIDDEAVRIEQQRLDDLAAVATAKNAEDARLAQIQTLRDDYKASTHTLCDIFSVPRVDVLTMAEIKQRGAALTDLMQVLQAMQTAMALSNIETKLCMLDRADALDRVSEVAQ